MSDLTRRRLLVGSAAAAAGGVVLRGGTATAAHEGHDMAGMEGMDHAASGGGATHAGHAGGHANFRGGRTVDHAANGFNPHEIVRDFDWGKTSKTASGRTIREWELVAQDKNIEIAPGVTFAAWTYNGRIPGPTLRAREGDLLRIRFVNHSAHPHTIHFHGVHPSSMDGVAGQGAGEIQPGGSTVYEFDATPAGLHLYHCHVRPLAEHIAKGMYGAFIVDPREGLPEADELVFVMNGFDTNFDRTNELYAVNTIPFAYMNEPIKVGLKTPIRAFVVNILEYDLINSFHLHANFFDWYPTGTSRMPVEFTDTVMLCQGQRGIAEWEFQHPGQYMFHAHQSEFTELGWQGFFEVTA